MIRNALSPSQRPFMGATPYDAGVTFRVWAPFAQQVAVAGQFNNWSTNADVLIPEGNGYWSVDVPGATVGQHYKFVVFNPANNLHWRMDPYARSILHDANGNLNGLIASSDEIYAI